MKYETCIEVTEALTDMLNTIPASETNTWGIFARANSVISTFDELDCLMNINFANGIVSQGICIITDWTPGLIVLQSDEGELPKAYVVAPEDTADFMRKMKPLLEPKFPEFPKVQE